jgi:hypothetical protein
MSFIRHSSPHLTLCLREKDRLVGISCDETNQTHTDIRGDFKKPKIKPLDVWRDNDL